MSQNNSVVQGGESSGARWTAEDQNQVLNAVRQNQTPDQIHALFPQRSLESVRHRIKLANKIVSTSNAASSQPARRKKTGSGIRSKAPVPWSDEDNETVRNAILAHATREEIRDMFPARTLEAVETRIRLIKRTMPQSDSAASPIEADDEESSETEEAGNDAESDLGDADQMEGEAMEDDAVDINDEVVANADMVGDWNNGWMNGPWMNGLDDYPDFLPEDYGMGGDRDMGGDQDMGRDDEMHVIDMGFSNPGDVEALDFTPTPHYFEENPEGFVPSHVMMGDPFA